MFCFVILLECQEPGASLGGLDKGRKGSTKNFEARPTPAGGATPAKTAAPASATPDKPAPKGAAVTAASNGTGRPEGNPFEEEEWDEYPNDALVDNGEPGVAVRALYDYDGAEYDELSFKKGALLCRLLISFWRPFFQTCLPLHR